MNRCGRKTLASLLVLSAASAGLAGCSSDQPGGRTAGTKEASAKLWQAQADVEDAYSDAVVSLASGGCTGTLITPTLVLTAAHCVKGGIVDGEYEPGGVSVGSMVGLGLYGVKTVQSDKASSYGPFPKVVRFLAKTNGPVSQPDDMGSDLAIVEIFPPVVTEAIARRPAFIAPSGGSDVHLPSTMVGWGRTEQGPTGVRRRLSFVGEYFRDSGVWFAKFVAIGGDYMGIDKGDSGGPLFWGTDPSTRQQIGVTSAREGLDAPEAGDKSFWVDITEESNIAFIQENAADPARPGKWKGEGDYVVAPCQPDVDPDCDGFYDTVVCSYGPTGKTCKQNDLCPGIYNPAQLVAPDTTIPADGLADGPFEDDDKDGIPNYCDPMPNCPSYLYQGDADGDGVCDPLDDCPCTKTESNPVTTGDGDPFCGACDASPSAVLPDGTTCGTYCDSAVSGVVFDSCPEQLNTSMLNDNVDSERAQGAETLADECEPVPVPSFTPVFGEVLSEQISYDSGSGPLGNWFATKSIKKRRFDHLDMRYRGSFGRFDTPLKGKEVKVTVDQTSFWYCMDLDLPGKSIRCNSLDYANDSYVIGSRATENESSVWHRVWVDGAGDPSVIDNPFFGPHNYTTKEDVPDPVWHQVSDFQAWVSLWGPNVGLTVPSLTSASTWPGRLWAHSDTKFGMTVNVFTGKHRKAGGSAADVASQQSNHYEMADTIDESITVNFHNAPAVEPVAPWKYCANCELEKLPQGEPDVCPSCVGMAHLSDLSSPHESQLLVKLPPGVDSAVKYGILLHDGSIGVLAGKVSESVASLLDSPGASWAAAVEAVPSAGRGGALPAALVLSADGRSIVERVSVRGHGLGSWLGGRGGRGWTAPVTTPVVAATELDREEASGPEARTGFTGVYSRFRGDLFVLGGSDPVTGTPVRSIWRTQATPGASWTRVIAPGYTPGKVMAATYSYRDGKLWVLDEIKLGLWKMARLVRIDPDSGDFSQIGVWPRVGLFDKHWLVLDQQGQVLLAASSSTLRKHAVIKLENQGPHVSVEQVYWGQGALATAPMVDVAGYSFVIAQTPTKPVHNTHTRRLTSLGGVKGAWSHLNSCW